MVNAAESKKYIGNAALYLDLERSRNRTFLRRNVTQVLESHKRALDAPETDALDSSMWNDYGNNHAWEFPTREALDLLARRSQPLLKIDIKSLLPTKPDQANQDHPELASNLFTAECRIDFKIWTIGEERNVKDVLVVDSRRATLQARRTEQGHKVFFDVSMEEPLVIKLEKLLVNVPRGPNESGFKKTVASSYTLAFVFSFPTPEDAAVVVPILNGQGHELPKNLALLQVRTKGRWLPKCPPGPFRLSRITNKEVKELDYSVNAEIGWQTSTETRLQTYNRVLRSARATREPQITPSASTVRQSGNKKVQLTYLFKGPLRAKSLSLEGCLCIFCHRRDFHTLERLNHHIKAEHDMLRCKFENEGNTRRDGNIVNVSIEVSISDRYSDARASNNVADARDIDWIAPKKPFNMARYLAGDESWVAEGQGSKRKSHASRTPAVAAALNRVQPKRPSEVLDLPEPKRKKYKVPKANGRVRFFRTDSKRMLEEGEYLSESDDDTNEAWLKLRCNQATQQVDANVSQKTFMMTWGDHMLDEQLSGDIHLGDAVVRFVRKHLPTLQRPDQSREFTKKMEELREDGIISQEVFDACKDALVHGLKPIALDPELAPRSNHVCTALRESSTRANLMSSSRTHKAQSGSHVGVGVNENGEKSASGRRSHSLATDEVLGEETTAQDRDGDIEMMDEPRHERSITKPPLWEEAAEEPAVAIQTGCTCGKVVEDNRTAICCTSLDCRRQEFHLKCIQLDRRVPGWKCPDCR
ncbi:uncharacterized protein K452DRAFT_105327 [Aplosporella prunicola CBS 121167]|uniref:Polycomb protein VEFS-Box domain-containing protein n=1 Tax=Aplosporella prunicola CBS 121167 TaxID=1176127 RepID=A0A6A6BPK7_9PEZI|nr:uncharacterized protein K452DRAFT_105327 [Aplosporella prunicola CBS 121167]KAF2146069.1 hypothetical protein K452DRAFT_105327 [Aplosporella prunicola CBS 121167]